MNLANILLNLRDPKVSTPDKRKMKEALVAEMLNIVKFWIDEDVLNIQVVKDDPNYASIPSMKVARADIAGVMGAEEDTALWRRIMEMTTDDLECITNEMTDSMLDGSGYWDALEYWADEKCPFKRSDTVGGDVYDTVGLDSRVRILLGDYAGMMGKVEKFDETEIDFNSDYDQILEVNIGADDDPEIVKVSYSIVEPIAECTKCDDLFVTQMHYNSSLCPSCLKEKNNE